MTSKARHAQERESVKASRPDKLIAAAQRNITLIRENVPVLLLTGVAFGASYGHIAKLCGDFGPHGWVQFATAGCVDLLCIIGAEERQRDKRIGRPRRGIASWPTIVLFVGIAVTLAANMATADRQFFGYCVAAWPAGALLLAVSILERRASYETPLRIAESELQAELDAERSARQQAEDERDAARTETDEAVTEAEALARELAAAGNSRGGNGRQGSGGGGGNGGGGGGNGDRKRTDEEWLAEIRKLHADQGDALSVRKLMPQLKLLGGGSAIAIARATDMLRQVKAEAGPDQASEEAV